MNSREIVKRRFLKKFESKAMGNIGVELEFPLLNLNKAPVDKDVCLGLLAMFLNDGFTAVELDTEGNPAFVENSYGDVLSFDNSYNNYEFSMNYGDSLIDIQKRFTNYYKKAMEYLLPKNYTLTGLGTNPYKKHVTQSHVSFPVYNMVDEYLHKFAEDTHGIPDFPAYLSSVQTHLDVNIDDLPRAFNLFSKAGYVRAMLFGNSIGFDGEKVLCHRDYLWENSAFGKAQGITGKTDTEFKTTDDIVESFLNRSMFNRIRNGCYEVFEPVRLAEYFDNPKYGAEEKDIECFLSFRDVEITARGTLEIRGDCAQPVYDAFLPPAFNLGLLYNMDKALTVLDNGNNTELRNAVINREIYDYKKAKEICDIAYEGLVKRGKGEEAILKPIYNRVENKTCPAEDTIKILEQGCSIEEIIKKYSKVEM